MSANPYSWAARVGDQGQADKSAAQSWEQNSLMQMFQEEAARQRPFVTMPAELAQQQYAMEAAEPFQIAREQRGMQNDMALRRFYAQNPIPRADDETSPAASTGLVTNADGSQDFTIGGKTFRRNPDGTTVLVK